MGLGSLLLFVAVLQDPKQGDKEQDRIERLQRMIRELNEQNTALNQKISDLQKENEELKQQRDQAENAVLSRSTEISSLKQQLASVEEEKNRLADELSRRRGEGSPNTVGVTVGPTEPMTGFVIGKGKDYGFVLVTIDKKGPKDEPKVGYEFEIVRDNKAIARGEVVKLHGDDPKAPPKLQIKITRGDVNEVRIGDAAIAKRKIESSGAIVKEDKKIAKITGSINKDLFTIDAGRNEGLSIGDRVFVYRANAVVGILRLEMCEFETSVGRLVEGSGPGNIDKDCDVHFEQVGLPKKSIIGRIAYVDRDIVVDVGTRGQARPGQKYEVRRSGKRVGYVTIKDARYDHSFCEPCDGTDRKDLQKDDVVELIKD
jgi:hypothetical protein